MADDTMEICTTYYGDEDFDFDFDLTAPAENEDTILEDVNSTGYSEKSQGEIFPASNELMNDDDDDDDESIKEMVDIETFSDSERTKNQDDLMLLNTGNVSNSDGILTNSEMFGGQICNESNSHIQHDFTEDKTVENDASREDTLENSETFLENANDEFRKESPVPEFNNVEPPNSAPSQSPYVQVLPSSGPPSSGGQRSIHDDKRAISTSLSTYDDALKDSSVSQITSDNYDLGCVVVLYQANEYALFSSSDLEDPNSFFIKDRTIALEPLNELFVAIRNVVQEDLVDESELYISFPNFGFQIEETSSLVKDITLSKIICLRNQLILNDGVDLPQPMYINLGIRKNFAKELKRIASCAKDGKGLSEIASWQGIGDEITDLNSSADGFASSDKQPVCEQCTVEEEFEENLINCETEYTCEANFQKEVEEEPLLENTPEPETENCEDFQNNTGLVSPKVTNTSTATPALGSIESAQKDNLYLPNDEPKDCEPASNSVYNSGSDIIDYSEDEIEEYKIPEACTIEAENEDKSDSNWKNNEKTSKNTISLDVEENPLTDNIESSKNTDCSTFLQTKQSRDYKQDNGISANKLVPNKEDDFQVLEERPSRDQASCDEGFHESITDLEKNVNIPNDINEVKVLDDNTSEFHLKCDRFDENEAQESDSKVHPNDKNYEYESDFIEKKIRDSPCEDEVNNFHDSVQGEAEESHVVFITGVEKTFKDLDSDRCTRWPSNEPDELHVPIPQFDQIGGESEDEIDYEDEEDEEMNFRTETLSSNLQNCQPIVKNLFSINGKRSRADCRLEATTEKIGELYNPPNKK
ncbi:hypothetical protein GcC1_215035 [Golovinomyces cichoracearum]|uniref:Uncharacterized protein n=1 Tax=Golovinomyces cichoracearum TaxID=62708 RepID=A0A420H9F4_9PEZI|nr:hypothetical protein GcC1_215035 [Golovinomyces cichoracearum]